MAGGAGTRMGNVIPKQFLLLNEKPILYYSLKAFLEAYADIKIILVLPQDYMDMGLEVLDAYFDKERIQITIGGDTRFQSVKNALALIEEESMIFVHDAVRCLITTSLIQRCYEKAQETGTAIPVVSSKDSIRLLTEEGNESIDRNKVMLVQTPQVFHSKILQPAYEIDYKDKFTDEASVAESFGMKLSLVQGEEANIKITHPLDMLVAERILADRNIS